MNGEEMKYTLIKKLITGYCYLYWEIYRTNKKRGSKEGFAKWQASTALSLVNIWLFSPILMKLMDLNIMQETKKEYIFTVLPFIGLNILFINFIISNYYSENLKNFQLIPQKEIIKFDRILLISLLIVGAGIFFIDNSLRNAHLRKMPRSSGFRTTEERRNDKAPSKGLESLYSGLWA